MGRRKSYYAVRVGRQPGIYRTWEDCEVQVKGYSKAQFKGFDSRDEAQQYLGGGYAAAAGGMHTQAVAAAAAAMATAGPSRHSAAGQPGPYYGSSKPPKRSREVSPAEDGRRVRHVSTVAAAAAAPPAAAGLDPSSYGAWAGAGGGGSNGQPTTSVMLMFDGGSRGNGAVNGSAGYGYVLYGEDDQVVSRGCGTFYENTTNNVAEYTGLIKGLQRALAHGVREVTIKGDSKLVINQINAVWAVKHPNMKPLHEEAMELLQQFERWSASHVRREGNKDADALSNLGMDLDVAIRRVGRIYQAMQQQQQSTQGLWEEGEERGGNNLLRLEEVDRQLVVQRLLRDLGVGEGTYQQLMAAPELLPAAAEVFAKLWDGQTPEQVADYMRARGWLDYEPWQ